MRGVPTIRNVLYGSIAVCLALLGQHRLEGGVFFDASVLYLAALALFVYTFRGFILPTASAPKALGASLHANWWWGVIPTIAAITLALLALNNLEDVERPTLTFWHWHLASVGLFLLSALLFDFRFWILDFRLQPPTPQPANNPKSKIQNPKFILLLLPVIFALAAFLRLWRFDSLPFGTWYDEAENGLQALRIMQNPDYHPIFVGSIHAPSHYLYLIVAAFEYFGVSTQSIRLVSVAMGLATVLAGYLVGRELFGRAGGLMLAFLLAVSRWNVNFSRIGMYNASTPLFALLVMGFLLRGLRRGRYSDFTLAGLWLGLGLCFYAAFQLFVAVVVLFLLILAVAERGFVQRFWTGLVMMFGMTILVIAPVLLYADEKLDVYFARTKDTSIFANKTPEQRLPALLENVRKHVLMFNEQGDPNGRHNLPGEPMLDPYSGALMVLGLGLCLWGFRQPRLLLLPLWLFVTLLGGILSLDFEAPQSLRAIGTLPAAYLLAVVPLHLLWQAWRQGGGRYLPNLVVAPLALFFALLGYNNFHTYFFRQAYDFASWNAFSTPETIAANLLANFDEQTDAYVISFFHGHPTLNFLARGAKPYQRLETTDHLPLSWPADKNIALIVNAESRNLFEEARRYYPQARFEEFQPPFGGPTVIDYALLSPQDIAGVQGLTGKYYQGEAWSGEPALIRQDATLSFDWEGNAPLPAPFSVEWEGVLRVGVYGPHHFFLQAPGQAELYVGEEQILAGTGELANGVVLGQGNHSLRVRAVGAPGPFSLSWRPPDREPEIIPAASLYVSPVTSNGLLGRYFPNAAWQAPETFAKIDPQLNLYFHIVPLPRPYTVEWSGKIAIPQPGLYRFGLESIDEATLWIDGQEVTTSKLPNVYTDGAIDLAQGLHDIRIRFSDRTDHTHINFYWAPPGAGVQLVPSEVLFPPQGSYERVTLPNLAALIFDPTAPVAPQVVSAPLAGNIRLVQTGLNQPRGIAAGADGTVYVADTGNRRVLILSPAGEVVRQLDAGSQPFLEPFDLDVDVEGNLLVLDASLGQLSVFSAEGDYLRDVPAPKPYLERARGLHIDTQDRIWVANTPSGRIAALAADGAVLKELPVWSGADSQPIDVAVGADGTIFVTDSGLHKRVRFDADGRRQLAWDIPAANSLDGSHLAVDGVGFLYMTQPEHALVTKLDAQGEQIGAWTIPGMSGVVVKPVGVAVAPDGQIWLADSAGGNVFVIEPGE